MTISILSLIPPLISAIFVFGLGIFVYFEKPKSKLNVIFALLCLSVSIWLFGTFMMFLSKDNDPKAIFWDRFIYIGVVFVPSLFYHFSLEFRKINRKKLLILSYILSFIFLVISRTDYFVSGLFKYPWGVHTQAQFFHHIFLIFFSFYLLLVLINFNKAYKKFKGLQKEQARYMLLAFFVLITIGSTAYLPAYKISIYPFSFISGAIFVAITAYAIVKKELFDIRVVLTELLVGLIGLVLLIQIFLAETFRLRVLNLGVFTSFIIFGYLLIKSTLKEIKLREELQVAYQDLKKLDEAKTEFISIASHQLRSPLSIIKGYISMLLEESYGKIKPRAEKVLKKVYTSNERLIKLVNDLLDISRMGAGKMKYNFQMVDLNKLVNEIVEELKLEAQENNLFLLYKKPKILLPKVRIDPEKFEQVILNVIDNAIRYTNKGEIKVKIVKKVKKVRIIVSDTGRGIDKEELAIIFGRFIRGKEVPRISPEGIGLGLYLSKMIVEAHQGKIWAESPGKDKGSTFYIELSI